MAKSVQELKDEIQDLKDQLQSLIERGTEAIEKAESENLTDAIFVAAQTHRLDLVSLLLTVVALILAVGGFIAFFEIRSKAKSVAEETAKSECKTIAQKIVLQYVNNELPDQVREHVETLMPLYSGNGENYGTDAETENKS